MTLGPEDQNRLNRFETKLDQVNEKLVAFPVVGQRISDMERRMGVIETEVHEIKHEVSGNATMLAKIGGIFTIVAVVGTLLAREFIQGWGS